MKSKRKPQKSKAKPSYAQWITNALLSLIVVGIVAIGLLMYSGKIDFGNTSNTDIINEYNMQDAIDQDIPQQCTLEFSDNDVCTGDVFTGTIQDGSNTNCYIFANTDGTWNFIYEGTTNEYGVWSETHSFDTEGTAIIRAICDLDNSGDFDENDCLTNAETLVITDCSSMTDGTQVGGSEGSETISGDQFTDEIDMSSITDGNCDLKARIGYDWHYVDADACQTQGIQGVLYEGLAIRFYDSTNLIYESIEPSERVFGMTYETLCGLDYDGVNNWKLEATKIVDIEGCEIEFNYDVDILTCNCQD